MIKTFNSFPSRSSAVVLALYWVVMFVGTHSPSGSETWLTVNDKVLHFSLYAGFGFLLGFVLCRSQMTRMRLFLVWSIVVLYGALDEFLQLLVPTRNADYWDWLADIAGGTAGLLILVGARRWYGKRANVAHAWGSPPRI